MTRLISVKKSERKNETSLIRDEEFPWKKTNDKDPFQMKLFIES